MSKFMADHIDRQGETIEYLSIAVAIYHLLPIPEGVVIVLLIMDG